MDGETNGGQEATQGAQDASQQQGQEQQETQQGQSQVDNSWLPNAGAASDEGKTLKHWREIAGLTDEDDEKKEG